MQSVPYASGCGSLMYAMVANRPDIAYVVGVVNRCTANLDKAYWNAVKSITRYLKGTKNKCLCYGKGPLELKSFYNSNMAGDVDTRKSTSGYVFTLQVVLYHGVVGCKRLSLCPLPRLNIFQSLRLPSKRYG